MTNQDKQELLRLLEAKENNLKFRKFYTYYFQDFFLDPITGLDISRHRYPELMKILGASSLYKELALIAPNRQGKTEFGSWFMTAHLTKDYPEWWDGYRCPNRACLFLFVGKTNLAARNVAQDKLLGSMREPGTGMIPHKAYNNGIGVDEKSFTRKSGIAECVLDLYVTDKLGFNNKIIFVSMDQDPEVIEGMAFDGVWFDENKMDPKGWYNEAFARTLTTNGFLLSTFTPWPDGMTESIINFMPTRRMPENNITEVYDDEGNPHHKFVIGLKLENCPHMTDDQKAIQKAKYKGAEYEARVLGIPALGKGAVYPIPVDKIIVPPIDIPPSWRRAYGLDFGWHETAIVWIAEDPSTHIKYVYSEAICHEATPFVVAQTIRANGDWIPGIADPAGAASNVADGSVLLESYNRLLETELTPGINKIESGIATILNLLESGHLKIVSTCNHLLEEYVLYRYGEHGKIADKQDDHALDALRYVISLFDHEAKSYRDYQYAEIDYDEALNYSTRDKITGY